MIITPASLSINQLFSATNEQYVIPAYQRRYSWRERQVKELINDISLIEDGDTHLLGSIVCLTSDHKPGLNKLELVDGQQRLTTIMIFLECIHQRLKAEGENNSATEVAMLLASRTMDDKLLRKIALDSIDSSEFTKLVENNQENEFQNQQLFSAFKIIREWVDEKSIQELKKFLYGLRNYAMVIRLDVSKAKDAFKLFETINNRGLRLSPTDIIKNFLLGNATLFSDAHLQNARKSWAALLTNLDGMDMEVFFRYYLMSLRRTRVTASEVVNTFKGRFMTHVTEAKDLPEKYKKQYMDGIIADQYSDDPSDDPAPENIENSSENLSFFVVEDSEMITFKNFLVRLVQCSKIWRLCTLQYYGHSRS